MDTPLGAVIKREVRGNTANGTGQALSQDSKVKEV